MEAEGVFIRIGQIGHKVVPWPRVAGVRVEIEFGPAWARRLTEVAALMDCDLETALRRSLAE